MASSLLIKVGAHPWRKCIYFSTVVRADDEPWKCLSCGQTVRVGQDVVVRRSAHEQTPKCYGPIEMMTHTRCWWMVSLTKELPALGPRGMRMEKYGDAYPFGPKW